MVLFIDPREHPNPKSAPPFFSVPVKMFPCESSALPARLPPHTAAPSTNAHGIQMKPGQRILPGIHTGVGRGSLPLYTPQSCVQNPLIQTVRKTQFFPK